MQFRISINLNLFMKSFTKKAKLSIALIIANISFNQAQTGAICSGTKGAPIFKETFGTGSALYGPVLGAGITTYPEGQGAPANGTYVIANTGNPSNTLGYVNSTDHTGDQNGYMMVINADYGPGEAYRKHVTGLCPNTTYVFHLS